MGIMRPAKDNLKGYTVNVKFADRKLSLNKVLVPVSAISELCCSFAFQKKVW